MNLKETYNRIAEDWHRDHQKDDWWVEGTDAFIALLGAGKSVLDVGCGAGVKSHYLASKGCQVTGIDLSESMIAIAKREVSEADFRVLDMREVGVLEDLYDGVFAQASLLHIPKAEAPDVIKALAAKLKPHGAIYIAVKEQRANNPSEEVVTENDYGYEYSRFFSYYTLEEIESYCREAGLTPVQNALPQGAAKWVQVIARKS